MTPRRSPPAQCCPQHGVRCSSFLRLSLVWGRARWLSITLPVGDAGGRCCASVSCRGQHHAFLCLGLLPGVLRVRRVPFRGLGWWGAGACMPRSDDVPQPQQRWQRVLPVPTMVSMWGGGCDVPGGCRGSGQHYGPVSPCPLGVTRCPLHCVWRGCSCGSPAPFKLLHTF